MTSARIAHGALVLMAAAGLVCEYLYSLSLHPDLPLLQTARYISFFTIQTNALILLAAVVRSLGYTIAPGARAALSAYIVVVAVVFQTLLAAQHHFTGVGWWGNLFAHQIVPLLWVGCWIGFGPHGGIDRGGPWRWLIYPLGYCGWNLGVGAVTGWYPYFFIDPGRSGWGVAGYIAAIALLFLLLGLAARAIDARLARVD